MSCFGGSYVNNACEDHIFVVHCLWGFCVCGHGGVFFGDTLLSVSVMFVIILCVC